MEGLQRGETPTQEYPKVSSETLMGGGGASRPSAALAPSAPAAHPLLMRLPSTPDSSPPRTPFCPSLPSMEPSRRGRAWNRPSLPSALSGTPRVGRTRPSWRAPRSSSSSQQQRRPTVSSFTAANFTVSTSIIIGYIIIGHHIYPLANSSSERGSFLVGVHIGAVSDVSGEVSASFVGPSIAVNHLLIIIVVDKIAQVLVVR